MDKKVFIGMYHNDSELMAKIDNLKTQGIDGENIYVIAQDDSDVTMFQGMKYGDVQTTPDSWFDRFLDFLTGENHVRSMLQEVGVPEGDMDNYYSEIQNGGKLLYVDQGELNYRHTQNATQFDMSNNGTDPNLGANRVTDYNSELLRSEYKDELPDTRMNQEVRFGKVGGEAVTESRSTNIPPTTTFSGTNRFNGATHYEEDFVEAKKNLRKEADLVNKEFVERHDSLHNNTVQAKDHQALQEDRISDGNPNYYKPNENEFNIQQNDETIQVPIDKNELDSTVKPNATESTHSDFSAKKNNETY